MLQFTSGGRALFRHRLHPGRTVVGRSDRCDVALPADGVSRTHCVIDGRPDGWWLIDRSRHGTLVRGAPATRVQLAEGDTIGIGPYAAIFTLEEEVPDELTTTTAAVQAAGHEEIVEVREDGVAASRACVRVTGGPAAGRTLSLMRARQTLGGPGSDHVLSPDLPRGAVILRAVRGRVMVEPGPVPVLLAGTRVREITPVLPGEELRFGEHSMVIDVETVSEEAEELASFGEMVGRSASMRKLFGVLRRMAAHDAPVLLTGESGTGKELSARALHEQGSRGAGPFVAVNCAAITDTLFESELFGHEKGSFTGATTRQDGAFQRANGGTLFLDEVGELKADAQAKLLRALESGEVRRVGGANPEYPDVRIISATNRNLQRMVSAGTFRADLYFRLAVLTVRMPSLADRISDVPLLARTLLARNHPSATLTEDGAAALTTYSWPGNVRELRNVLTRAFVLGGPSITAGSLSFNPWAFEEDEPEPTPRAGLAPRPGPPQGDDPERAVLIAALDQAEGNRTRAARDLGIPRSSLLYKLRRHGLG
jgi:DNA-binding NtrC family response regulator